MDRAEDGISTTGLSGEAADTAREQYKDLDKRFDRLIENEGHKNLFLWEKPIKCIHYYIEIFLR